MSKVLYRSFYAPFLSLSTFYVLGLVLIYDILPGHVVSTSVPQTRFKLPSIVFQCELNAIVTISRVTGVRFQFTKWRENWYVII